jgi:hypothetical protein
VLRELDAVEGHHAVAGGPQCVARPGRVQHGEQDDRKGEAMCMHCVQVARRGPW